MTRFLLDTNIPSEVAEVRPDPRVMQWLRSQSETSLLVSVISIGELRKGVELLAKGRRRRELEEWLHEDIIPNFGDRILPVTLPIAERWGIITSQRRLQGMPLNVPDGLIAATAIEHNLTLVTRNVKDFVHLGVPLFNPWE